MQCEADKVLLKKLCRLWTDVALKQDSQKRTYVKLLTDIGEHNKAVTFFGRNSFIAMENNYEIRRVYVQAHLGLARKHLAAPVTLLTPLPRPGSAWFSRRGPARVRFSVMTSRKHTCSVLKPGEAGDIGGAISDYQKCLEVDRDAEDHMRPFQLQALSRLNLYAKIGMASRDSGGPGSSVRTSAGPARSSWPSEKVRRCLALQLEPAYRVFTGDQTCNVEGLFSAHRFI